jgi:hypothetical protein
MYRHTCCIKQKSTSKKFHALIINAKFIFNTGIYRYLTTASAHVVTGFKPVSISTIVTQKFFFIVVGNPTEIRFEEQFNAQGL